jgi:hypothetical protein
MERDTVNSSHIESIGYDEITMILEVEFKKGEIYQYYSIPSAIYYALMSASSHGSYLKENIEGNYRYLKIN